MFKNGSKIVYIGGKRPALYDEGNNFEYKFTHGKSYMCTLFGKDTWVAKPIVVVDDKGYTCVINPSCWMSYKEWLVLERNRIINKILND